MTASSVGVPEHAAARAVPDTVLAWYFVVVWGAGYLASKTALRYAPPFTLLTLRFAFGVACMGAIAVATRPRWPRSPRAWFHVVVAGLLMHAVYLAGSHYGQYLGLSAGITAVLLATQPLLTAFVLARREPLIGRQWVGIALGLAGVLLVVGHQVDIDAASTGGLVAVAVSLVAITVGTLYQRTHCRDVDLTAGGVVQLGASLVVVAPLAVVVEGFAVRWDWRLFAAVGFLVVCGSILAVNALNVLMRHGHAARVTSLLYLTPIVAVFLEWLLFGVVPAATSIAGIAVTCAGVALVTWRRATAVPAVET